MGSSKVLLLGGFCIVVGCYASAIFQSDSEILQLGQAESYQSQASLIAFTGAQIAAYYLSTPSWSDGVQKKNYPLYGGKLTYIVDVTKIAEGEATVYSKGEIGGVKVQISTQLSKIDPVSKNGRRSWNQWTVKKMFIYPNS
jgi:hypothetical protein